MKRKKFLKLLILPKWGMLQIIDPSRYFICPPPRGPNGRKVTNKQHWAWISIFLKLGYDLKVHDSFEKEKNCSHIAAHHDPQIRSNKTSDWDQG